MSTLTTKQRMTMDAANFGDPQRRLFPIMDQSDVNASEHLIGRAADPGAVKKRIISIARRKGLHIPDAWAGDTAAGKRMAGDAVKNSVSAAYGKP